MKRTQLSISLLLLLAVLSACISPARHQDETPLVATNGTAGDMSTGTPAANSIPDALHKAAVGGPAGEYIAAQMDRQTIELNKQFSFGHARRLEEGIEITVPTSKLFNLYGATLRDTAQKVLSSLAGILKKYKGTELIIEGHTDSLGTVQYNLELSKRQAEAVGNFLITRGVAAIRLKLIGYGEAQPADTSNRPEALEANRRIVIGIFAGEQLKAAARAGH